MWRRRRARITSAVRWLSTSTKKFLRFCWLYDLLLPQVEQVLVCNPRRNALLKEGSKSDKVDARKLAELLRSGMLRPVYHGENGLRTLRELARSYQTISKDLTRVMNRLKALYRGWSIPCAGTQVYTQRYREERLNKLPQAGLRRRAELLYQQLDGFSSAWAQIAVAISGYGPEQGDIQIPGMRSFHLSPDRVSDSFPR